MIRQLLWTSSGLAPGSSLNDLRRRAPIEGSKDLFS